MRRGQKRAKHNNVNHDEMEPQVLLEGSQVWAKFGKKWFASIISSEIHARKSTLRQSLPFQANQENYYLIFFPHAMIFSWCKKSTVCPFNKPPLPVEPGILDISRIRTEDSKMPQKFAFLSLGEEILDISDMLPMQAVSKEAQNPKFWHNFSERAASAESYEDLGSLLVDTKEAICKQYLCASWLKINSFDWSLSCLSADSAQVLADLNQELQSAVQWNKVGRLWSTPTPETLSSDWLKWKEPWTQKFAELKARAQYQEDPEKDPQPVPQLTRNTPEKSDGGKSEGNISGKRRTKRESKKISGSGEVSTSKIEKVERREPIVPKLEKSILEEEQSTLCCAMRQDKFGGGSCPRKRCLGSMYCSSHKRNISKRIERENLGRGEETSREELGVSGESGPEPQTLTPMSLEERAEAQVNFVLREAGVDKSTSVENGGKLRENSTLMWERVSDALNLTEWKSEEDPALGRAIYNISTKIGKQLGEELGVFEGESNSMIRRETRGQSRGNEAKSLKLGEKRKVMELRGNEEHEVEEDEGEWEEEEEIGEEMDVEIGEELGEDEEEMEEESSGNMEEEMLPNGLGRPGLLWHPLELKKQKNPSFENTVEKKRGKKEVISVSPNSLRNEPEFKSEEEGKIILETDVSRGQEITPIPCVVDMKVLEGCGCLECQRTDIDGLQGPLFAPCRFTYITQRRLSPALELQAKTLQVGCSCNDDKCDPEFCSHVDLFHDDNLNPFDFSGNPLGRRFSYGHHGRIQHHPNLTVYECNDKCQCMRDCPNRVLQAGVTLKLEVFRTYHKGWGLRANEFIPKGTFVCEYLGEVISDDEANRRGLGYDRARLSYLYDIDAHISSEDLSLGKPFVIDATGYGNVSRFINHSCAPNLANYQVLTESLDAQLAHIGFFASRDIPKGEELTYDYRYTPVSGEGCPCHCGAPTCRGRLY